MKTQAGLGARLRAFSVSRRRRSTNDPTFNPKWVEPLECRTLLSAALIKDLNTVVPPFEHAPSVAASFGSNMFFVHEDREHGRELWKTDGTPAGTSVVKDMEPGPADSNPQAFAVANGKLFVVTERLDGLVELWVSDGTEAGTIKIPDLRPDIGPPNCGLVSAGNVAYIFESDRIWRSDGTVQGTTVLSSGTALLGVDQMIGINGAMFFSAYSQPELWRSDASGTALVKDIYPGGTGSYPSNFVNVNGTLFFTATNGTNGTELWKSDGTANNTVLVKDIRTGTPSSNPIPRFVVGDTLYFAASDGTNGTELWKTDGTAGGTVLVADIQVGTGSSNPGPMALVDNMLYFAASGGTSGIELWKTDVTTGATAQVADLSAGSSSSSPQSLVNVNGTLFFTASNAATGRELWKSDGSAAGTVAVKDINVGAPDGVTVYRPTLTSFNGTVVFAAAEPTSGLELWKSDGTAEGTTLMLGDLWTGTTHSNPTEFTQVNDVLYFTADDGQHGLELFKTDLTSGGTSLVKDIVAGATGSGATQLTSVNGTLFFTVGGTLWKSDGTVGGTVALGGGSGASKLTNVNGTLFFVASSGAAGAELWKSNGTVAGTVLVKDIFPGTSSSNIQYPIAYNGSLLFSADDGSSGQELWKSDGTAAGTLLLKDISVYESSSPSELVVSNGYVYFAAFSEEEGLRELWRTNGTWAGTARVADLAEGDSNPQRLTDANGILFFVATVDGETGLYKTNGTAASTLLLNNTLDWGYGSDALNPTAANGKLFFVAPVDGYAWLWKSDGTVPGTVPVRQIEQDVYADSYDPFRLAALNDRLYFVAYDATHGTQLWTSDGTSAGTKVKFEMFPGTGRRYPTDVTLFNGALVFDAYDPAYGKEPWRYRPTAAPGGPYQVEEGGTVNLSPAVNPGEDIVGFAWDLDADGIFGETGLAAARGNEDVQNPTFSAAGLTGLTEPSTATVSLRVTDAAGLFETNSTTVTINPPPPAAPSALVATASGPNGVELTWTDNSSNESGFVVESSVDGVRFRRVATVAAGTVSYPATGLTGGVRYFFRVGSYNGGIPAVGGAVYSATADATTPAAPRPVVINLTAAPAADRRVVLAWTPTSDTHDSLNIEHSTDGIVWTTVAVVSGQATTYTVGSALPAGASNFRVSSADGSVDPAEPSTPATATPQDLPPGPTGLTAVAPRPDRVQLAWSDDVEGESRYLVEQLQSGSWVTLETLLPDGTWYSVTGLQPGTSYSFRVRAETGAPGGPSLNSEVATVVTPAAPAAPTGLTVVSAGARVELTWEDNATSEAAYRIERSTNGTDFSLVGFAPPDAIGYTMSEAAGGTTYTFRVSAIDASGYAGAAATSSPTLTVPRAPFNVEVSVDAAEQLGIDLDWDGVTGADYYEVERGTDGNTFAHIASVAAEEWPYFFDSDEPLSEGTRYYYRIRGVNDAGPGPYSNVASSLPRLPAPTTLTATFVAANRVDLTWPDTSTTETGYQVSVFQIRPNQSQTSQVIATLPPNTTSFSTSGVLITSTGDVFNADQMQFTVTALGIGSASSTSTAYIDIPTQRRLNAGQVEGISTSEIRVSWVLGDEPNSISIYRGTYNGQTGNIDYTFLDTVTGTGQGSFVDSGLTEGLLYHYKYVSSSGESVYTESTLPAAPTDLTVGESPVRKAVLLNWKDNSASESNWDIEKSTDGGTTWQFVLWADRQFAPTKDGYASALVKNLNVGTEYMFRVTSFVRFRSDFSWGSLPSQSAPSNTVTATPFSVNQLDVYAEDVSHQSVILNLTGDPTGATDTVIERSVDGGPFLEIDTVPAGTYEYPDTAVRPDTTYTYRARATDGTYTSPPAPLSFDGHETTTTFGIPVQLGSTRSDQIDLSWVLPAGVTGDVVLEQSADGHDFSPIATLSAAQQSHTVDGLTAGPEYLFRIIYADGGHIRHSDIARGKTSELGLAAVRRDAGFSAHTFVPHVTTRYDTFDDKWNFSANDDATSEAIPLGFTVNFYGRSFDTLYIGENGYVTFDPLGYPLFDPNDDTTTTSILAPFLANGSRLPLLGGNITYGWSQVDGHDAFAVTWTDVGFRGDIDHQPTGPTNTFQLVLIDQSGRSAGDVDVEFNYDRVTWESSSWSDGKNWDEVHDGMAGPDGVSAAGLASNGSGRPSTIWELSGSKVHGAFVDGNATTGLVHNSLNSVVKGRYRIPFHSETDLDVDSFNDNGYDVPNPLTRLPEEDEIEDVSDDPAQLGKLVRVNDDDLDGDDIPDFADGYDRDGASDTKAARADDQPPTKKQGARFVPLVIEIPASFDLSVTRLRLVYDDSDPLQVLPPDAENGWRAAAGKLRLWTKDAYEQRSGLSFAAADPADTRGHFVPSTKGGDSDDPAAPDFYADVDLARLGFSDSNRIVTLWVEAVAPSASAADLKIELQLDEDGEGEDHGFDSTDAVRLTANVADLGIDSDNTSAAAPERDPYENMVEDSAGKPGKVIVVNDASKDNDDVPDFADGYPQSPGGENAAENLVPMVLQIPAWVDLNAAAFRFDYDGSDPSVLLSALPDGSFLAAPGEAGGRGTLRLWLRNADGTRGAYIDPGEGLGVAQLGLDPATAGIREISFFVEAVRGSTLAGDQRIELAVDPDGQAGLAAYVGVDAVRLTAVQASAPDAAQHGAVRLHDGSVSLSETDLLSGGYGSPFGNTRTWTNQLPFTIPASDAVAGTGVVVREWPRLIQGTSTVIVTRGDEAIYFDYNPAATAPQPKYTARYGALQQLRYDQVSDQFVLLDPDGSRTSFHGFGGDRRLGGTFAGFLDPAGNATAVDALTEDKTILRITRGSQVFEYGYVTAATDENLGKLASVTQKDGTSITRKVVFDYYESGDAQGNAGDLKEVVVQNSIGLELERSYYRYYRDGDADGYAGALKLYVGPGGVARLGSPTDLDSLTDAELRPYAEAFLRYDAQRRVISQEMQGAGPTQESGSTSGTFTYAYAPSDTAGVGINVEKFRTEISGPGSSGEKVYANFAGQTLRDVEQALWTTTTRYDADGRLARHTSPGGLATIYDYYDGTGGPAGYLQEVRLLPEGAGAEIKQRTLTYANRTGDDGISTIHPVQSETVYRNDNGTGAIPTSYAYALWDDLQPLTVNVDLPDVNDSTFGTTGTGNLVQKYDTYGRMIELTDGDGKVTSWQYDDATGSLRQQTLDVGGVPLSTIYLLDEIGRPILITRPNGGFTTVDYTDLTLERMVTTTSPEGVVTQTDTDLATGVTVTRATSPGGSLVQVGAAKHDLAGRTVWEERSPAAGTNYRTSYAYNARGLLETVTDPLLTVTKSTYDALGRLEGEWVGVGSELTKVATYVYDDGESGGDSNLTSVIRTGGSTTVNDYDERNRLTDTQVGTGGDATLKHFGYDNLGNVVSETIDGTQVHQATVNVYDDRGRLKNSAVDGGSAAGVASVARWYDYRGNETKTAAPGGLVTVTTYDGAGRARKVEQQNAAGTVFSETETTYDNNGNAKLITSTDHGVGGDRTSYVANYYDRDDRLTGTADSGTTAISAPALNETPPASSDSLLVTKYDYDDAGFLDLVTDPRGIKTKNYNDNLGRVTGRTTGFQSGQERTVGYEYNGLDQLDLVRTFYQTPQGLRTQETDYNYGVAKSEGNGVDSNSLLGGIVYHLGESGQVESEAFFYNAQQQLITKRDRTGNVHTYERDSQGRIFSDSASLATGVDNAVTALTYGYDALGRVIRYTSVGSGGNEVTRTYDVLGNVLDESQAHSGTVTSSSPAVHYQYAAANDGRRLTGMTYPDGRVVNFNYAGDDATINRVSSISDGAGTIESYGYLGLQTVLTRSRPLGGGTSIDQTLLLDAFGRVEENVWGRYTSGGGGTALEHVIYGYDRTGNRLFADNQLNSQLDELYYAGAPTSTNDAYTPHGEIQQFDRGSLDASQDSISSPITGSHAVYNRDGLGQLLTGQSDTTTGGGNTTTAYNAWGFAVTAKYDAWGRLVSTSQSHNSVTQTATYRYDALNRLIAVNEHAGLTFPLPTMDDSREFYHSAGGQVIEERTTAAPTRAAAQYVWSPAVGDIVLRDRDADGSAGTGSLGHSASGLEERVYSMTDPQGSVVAVADASGEVLERYIYDPMGTVQVLDAEGDYREGYSSGTGDAALGQYYVAPGHNFVGPESVALSGTHIAWRFYYQGQYFDRIPGFYRDASGGTFNPRQEKMMVPQSAAYATGGDAYDPHMEGWHEDVGFWEGLIPVWGNGKQAWYDFSHGETLTGLSNLYLAATDAVGIGLLVKAAAKPAVEAIGRRVTAEAFHDLAQNSSAYVRGFAKGLSHVPAAPTTGTFYGGAFDALRRGHRRGVDELLERTARSVHDEYVQKVLGRELAQETPVKTLWSEGARGVRKFDGYDRATRTGFEGNTTPWEFIEWKKYNEKITQIETDAWLLRNATPDSIVRRVVWFGTDALYDEAGRIAVTNPLARDIARRLQAHGIPYYVVRP